ncbi:MAG: hypothetical protein ACLP0J_08690 [Solirubrobacteraceae bacterium]
MAIRWNDISLLQALGRLEGEDRAYEIDGEQLMQIVAGDERCTDPDRASLTRLLYTLSQQGRLSFEIKDDPGMAVPSAENPRHLQWLWRFKLTETGRGRTRARVVPDQRPDPDEDDGRPIPGRALDRFADAIAVWYTPEQLPKFLRNAGLPRIHKVGTHGKTEGLSANLAAYERGSSKQRCKLRRFLAAFLNDELDPFPDSDQRDQLVAMLAEAGWHLKDDNLVIGECVIPAKPGATTATPEALERDEAIARASEAELKRDEALEQLQASERARQAAEQETERARQDVERAEQQATAAARRTAQAETNVADAVERAERAAQHARSERAELERELAEQREAREQAIARASEAQRKHDLALEQARVSELARRSERDRARAVLEAEQQLRAQLQTGLESTQRRLEAAEKARDAAIAAGERPATHRSTPRPKT